MSSRPWLAAISVVTCATASGVLGACKSRPAELTSSAEASTPAAAASIGSTALLSMPVYRDGAVAEVLALYL